MKKYIMMVLLLCCGIGAWADNIITLSNVQGAAGTEVTVSVSMTNTDAVSALQLSIPLDDNLTFVENSQMAGSRLSGHTLSAGVKDGVLNVMVYSSTMVDEELVALIKGLRRLGDDDGIVRREGAHIAGGVLRAVDEGVNLAVDLEAYHIIVL